MSLNCHPAHLSTIMVQTTPTDPAALARRPDPAGPLAVATPTTRRLADASLSRNTRRAYAGALRRLDAWRGTAPVDDASLAVYLGELFEAGRAPATAALAVAAVRFRAKLAGHRLLRTGGIDFTGQERAALNKLTYRGVNAHLGANPGSSPFTHLNEEQFR